MPRRIRFLYEWNDGRLERAGTIADARLHAWEYGVDAAEAWPAEKDGLEDTVRVWKTRVRDAKPELLVGDLELVVSESR